MEYARWLEEHHRRMCELRVAVDEHLAENELQLYVDNCLAHFDEIINIKSSVARTDVFHLISGSWKSPAERCFMWIGGFRPSQIIKVRCLTILLVPCRIFSTELLFTKTWAILKMT